MANESGNLGEGLDIGWAPRQDVNKVTEEAVKRIQEESKKAKHIQQQIQQDKQANNKLANFLSFLIKTIKDENIIATLYDLFFKTKHPKTGTTYLRKKINTLVIIWFFFPFYLSEAEKIWISSFFEDLLSKEPMNLTWYINYIKKLSKKYHDNIPLDSAILMEFLMAIINYYKLHDIPSLDQEQREKFVLHMKNELYS
jgi:type IV secretory pathway VirB6-like protein